MGERLSVEFERRDGRVALRLSGRLDAHTVPLVAGTLTALRAERSDVVLDLADVSGLDGAGVALLITAEADAAAAGLGLEITGLQDSLRQRTHTTPPPPEPAASGDAGSPLA